MQQAITFRQELANRVRKIRTDRFGATAEAVTDVARSLGIPARTWMNYEQGVTMPAEIMLRLIDLTGVDYRWLLTGEGEMYSGIDFGSDLRIDR